jgi:hypothetical protein
LSRRTGRSSLLEGHPPSVTKKMRFCHFFLSVFLIRRSIPTINAENTERTRDNRRVQKEERGGRKGKKEEKKERRRKEKRKDLQSPFAPSPLMFSMDFKRGKSGMTMSLKTVMCS